MDPQLDLQGIHHEGDCPKSSLCSWVYDSRVDDALSISALIQSGSSVDEKCEMVGRTALMLCAQKGWTDCVSVLLALGADAKIKDEFGRDALMLALIARKVECAKLLAPVSNTRSRDADGRSALALALCHAPHKIDADLLGALWSVGSDRCVGRDGKSAKDFAKEGDAIEAYLQFEQFKVATIESRCLGRSVPSGARASKRSRAI